MAEGIFKHLCANRGLSGRYSVESAAIGPWHAGEPADPRTIEACHTFGIELTGCARQVRTTDFARFDLILAMDTTNYKDLMRQCPQELRHKVRKMREFDNPPNHDADVPDPYYGGPEGFTSLFQLLHGCCENLLSYLESREGLKTGTDGKSQRGDGAVENKP